MTASLQNNRAIQELTGKGARSFGIELTAEQVKAMLMHLDELAKWNRTMNLTAITDGRDMAIKHVLDSLTYLLGMERNDGLRLLDLGSGAGFPALPLKIAWPELSVTMVDSVKKKASFLRHMVRMLSLANATVYDCRVEELPAEMRSSFDIITARAFSDIATVLTAGKPFLAPSGRLILSRGAAEILHDEAITSLGFRLEKKMPLTLPHSDNKRQLWVFRNA